MVICKVDIDKIRLVRVDFWFSDLDGMANVDKNQCVLDESCYLILIFISLFQA